jgi:hypothetical protein
MTQGSEGRERAPGVHAALDTTIELEVTPLIVPEERPLTEAASRSGMDIIVCRRAVPLPGVIVTVVKPTGSVATVVWALR